MSEYHIIETEFNNQGILIESLNEMGYKPLVHEQAKQLEGYQGDLRKQKAHIVIPRRQVGMASNDVGFERQKNGTYICHASEYDSSWRIGKKIQQLKQTYGEKTIMNVVKKSSKYRFISRNMTEEGDIKIRVRRM